MLFSEFRYATLRKVCGFSTFLIPGLVCFLCFSEFVMWKRTQEVPLYTDLREISLTFRCCVVSFGFHELSPQDCDKTLTWFADKLNWKKKAV